MTFTKLTRGTLRNIMRITTQVIDAKLVGGRGFEPRTNGLKGGCIHTP